MTANEQIREILPASTKGRVLLVNDQPALAEVERTLVAGGYEVRSTCNQQDALDMAKAFFEPENVITWPDGTWEVPPFAPEAFMPQFVMLGINMPVMLGTEL